MLKEINPSYLIISVVVNFVSKHTMICVFTVNEMLSLYSAARICAWFYLEVHVLLYIFHKKIDVCFQKMLSCLSNISFNIITCSVTCLGATQWKVNRLLTDLGADKWRRAIQVQVKGKLKTFADFSRFTLLITIKWYYPAFVLWAQWKCNWTFGRQEQFFTLKTSTFLSKN